MTACPHISILTTSSWGEPRNHPHSWVFPFPALAWPFPQFSPIPSPYYYFHPSTYVQQ
jgi:hypothetical protein